MAENVPGSQVHVGRRERIAEERWFVWSVSIGTLHSSSPSVIAVLEHVFVLRIYDDAKVRLQRMSTRTQIDLTPQKYVCFKIKHLNKQELYNF